MRKVEAQALTSIDDYRLVEAEIPQPGQGEVVVRVAACGVGYVDALVSLGRYQVKPPLPHTPGQEVGGVVASVGPEVPGIAAGDRVMATVRGGFAEYALASAAAVRRIPGAMAFAQAAGFHINYVTALHGLADRANLQPGETVLVLGAAGGLGAAGVQVAKLMGARVVAAASSEEKRAFCRELGCDEVIDTAPEGWRDRLKAACGGRGPDVVFDPVCGPLFEPAFRSLSWRGRHLVLGFVGGPIPALPANLTLMKGAALVGVDVRQFLLFEAEHGRAHLDQLLGWVGEGKLSPPVGRTFPFEAYAAALEFALTGQGLGKTVLQVASL
ncbi:NADPH:quinone oxidoreductase family protein [Phenylobacterium montanum]|uniref:NADPH:quinone oxidoreductase family protein n=1 Tax=Phenylobacterium montanum TaxID=2823693 RepID=A0A975ISN3_9CAUL|nr:NADPH:quinone oxidoreductase family protein [Caulobacter sp. S6]QUD85982.1 NADPH:quinone oxidoreductase family protein [Caulobacter sp. S6]